MLPSRTATAVLAVPLTVLVATSGCGSKKTTASSAPAHTAAAAAGGGGGGTSSTSTGSGSSKTCPAGDSRATINSAVKCLKAGQQCSSKAISQYPQYGFVCRKQTNGYLLARA